MPICRIGEVFVNVRHPPYVVGGIPPASVLSVALLACLHGAGVVS